jgi:hypothetical protein
MKEFIEKLIGRLEEMQNDKYLNGVNRFAPKERRAIEAAIEIVKKSAEEYNNGWIPCSERLPEIEGNTSDTVLVCTIDGFRHMAFWCADEKWRYCESGMIKNPMEWTVIIAWQPLPAPYKKGE